MHIMQLQNTMIIRKQFGKPAQYKRNAFKNAAIIANNPTFTGASA